MNLKLLTQVMEKASQQMYEVCVVGSGPAGIIFVLEYSRLNPNHNILLVEYGYKGLNGTNTLDETIEVHNTINHHSPYECTNKGFGGTSATWGGRCVMYDRVDFRDRPIIRGGCTWDMDLFDEINEYKQLAASYFECGNPVFNLNEVPSLQEETIAEGFKDGLVTNSKVERWSMPTRFGFRYAKEILGRPNVTIVQGAEARDFSLLTREGNVSSLQIRNVVSKKTFVINAKKFVVAAGTQETTRILLRNLQLFQKLNNPPKALGKYYQSHLSGKIASVRFRGNPKKTEYGFIKDEEGIFLRRRFQFSSDFLVENNLLNTAIWLDNPLYFDPKHRSGAMSFMYLTMLIPYLGKKLAPPAIAYSVTKGKVYKLSQHVWNILRDMPGSLLQPAQIFYKRYWAKRKLPGIFLYNRENLYALHFHAEQTPVLCNHMELGPDRETLFIHYNLTDDDVNSIIKLHEVLDEWLRKCGCGELEYWYEKEKLPEAIRQMSKDGIHQSGTTRLADSPEKGVVDRDLKVWGTSNVYVCSSSVFPTSGQANPTFMLGAFAARLAKHLTENIKY